MQFGIHLRPTDDSMDVRDMGRQVEARGFDALFFPEHIHIPTNTRSLFPEDPRWMEVNAHLLDPFVALATVAAVTEHLLLGTGVCLIVQRDPITLAKEAATLDLISGGRAIFGVGPGWNEEEMRNHGVDPARRWGMFREYLAAIRTIWREDVAEYRGRYVDFGPIYQWPKPVQRPGPPVYLGGEGPTVLDRVLRYCGGWMPNAHQGIEARVMELNRRAAASDRLAPPVPVTVFTTPWEREAIERYAKAGVTRCVFTIPAIEHDEIVAALDRLAELARPFQSGLPHSS